MTLARAVEALLSPLTCGHHGPHAVGHMAVQHAEDCGACARNVVLAVARVLLAEPSDDALRVGFDKLVETWPADGPWPKGEPGRVRASALVTLRAAFAAELRALEGT